YRRRPHGGTVGRRAVGSGLHGRQLGGDRRRDGPVHPAAPQSVGAVRRGGAGADREGVARLMADITMPQLGETVTEGTITKWLKQVGDQVAEDEVLFEVSTDKVDSEVPMPAAVYLSEFLELVEDTVAVVDMLRVGTSD